MSATCCNCCGDCIAQPACSGKRDDALTVDEVTPRYDDFLERLAPFSSPDLMLKDEKPRFRKQERKAS